MRLVAEAVVLAGGERVEALKPGAVGPHAEDGAAVRVASHGGTAVEKPSGCDQRAARPCAIGATEGVQDPQSGTRRGHRRGSRRGVLVPGPRSAR